MQGVTILQLAREPGASTPKAQRKVLMDRPVPKSSQIPTVQVSFVTEFVARHGQTGIQVVADSNCPS
jgi:hypothetical protein